MELQFTAESISKITSWRVKEGTFIKKGHVILEYAVDEGVGSGGNNPPVQRFKALEAGVVQGILASKGDTIVKGTPLLTLVPCRHPDVFNDMCGKCGVDLAKLDTPTPGSTEASSYVSMIHSVPGLKVSLKDAKSLDKTEEDHLLQHRQLRLLVDLDQTLIHTTNDTVPLNLKDVFHFQLWGHGSIWYHTRLRPRTRIFLENISKLYQLHICTFGSRNYAHTIAKQLDPTGNIFYNRILSRDECFSQNSKTANLKELFPNGDHMVCIIDDREDVWNYGPNLIHVKPYHFFRHTGDINAPPGFAKKDEDDKSGFDFTSPDGTVSKVVVNTLSSSQESAFSGSSSSKSGSEGSESQKSSASTIEGKSSGIKEVSKDLSLSDDDDSQDASATASMAMAEEKANDGDSESSSNDDEGTTESETDSTVKAQDASTNASTGESSEPSVVQEQNSESSSSASTPKAEVTSQPEPEPTLEMEVENLEIEKSEPNDVVTNPSATTEKENKKEDGELSDSSSLSQTGGEIAPPAASTVAEIPSLVQKKGDTMEVEDEDDYLLYLEDILRQIHEAFYRIYDDMKEKGKGQVPDVKNVIPYVRRKILKGCSIVFSGVVPMDRKLEKSRPYAVAQSLGAQVSDKIIPPSKQGVPSTSTASGKESLVIPTTHVVAARLGTAKVNEARRYKGVHVVTPNWLWCCAERWERVDERLFTLGKKSDVKRNPPAHCSSPDVSFSQAKDDYEMLTPMESFDSDGDAVFSQSGSIKPKNGQTPAARRGRTPSGRFMDTINPLFSFSMDDIESMGQEVDDICNESDSSSSDEEEKEQVVRKKPTKKTSPTHTPNTGLNSISKSKSDNSSSSETSDEEKLEARRAAGLNPRKRRREPRNTETETEDEPLSARFRRGEALPSDCDMLNLTNPSSDDDDDNEENEWMVRELEHELLGGDESRDRDSS